ncbi:MAG: tRNA dimethylallyltransferase [Patescibacteria group bacterium]|nr:tRNA dimethylallyltransferase [Patescibacteria group bacterium]
MDNVSSKLPLIVIAGPTASGKTSLAINIAKEVGGEIICADSRTVYKGMDIGTAKPTKLEQELIPHWGLDLVNPDEHFSVADFKKYAIEKIDEIRSRGNIPFMVGGTGLYIDSVILDYKFCNKIDKTKRKLLESMTLGQLCNYCNNNNIPLPENSSNKRYVVNAIERNGIIPLRRETPINDVIIVGITTEKETLMNRIKLRIGQLLNDGVIDEALSLSKLYGWDNEALKSNAYIVIHDYLLGDISKDDIVSKLATVDWRLAKRQLTWLRRNNFIHWGSIDDLKVYVLNQLAKHS